MCLFNDDAEIFFNPLYGLLLRIVGENLPDICVYDKKKKKFNIYFLNCSKKNNVIFSFLIFFFNIKSKNDIVLRVNNGTILVRLTRGLNRIKLKLTELI